MFPNAKNSNTLTVDQSAVNDSLLSDFSPAQREYIVQHIYPTLKKTLVHFVAEASLHNQIPIQIAVEVEDQPKIIEVVPEKPVERIELKAVEKLKT